MIRMLSKAWVLLLLTPLSAHALGLGAISLQSKLNQPMHAEIDLLSLEEGDLEKIQATLASREDFEKAGLDRPFLLSGLRFEIIPKGGDEAVVRITTRKPFREPFVSFLLKLEWPNGRLLREYTLLLDPPVVMRRAPTAVQNPVLSAPAPTARAPVVTAPTASPSVGASRGPLLSSAPPAPAQRSRETSPGEYYVERDGTPSQTARHHQG